jgi:hypothetical protein
MKVPEAPDFVSRNYEACQAKPNLTNASDARYAVLAHEIQVLALAAFLLS